MAQDWFSQFESEEDDPFAEFEEVAPAPLVKPPVAPVAAQPTQDDLLRDAQQFLAPEQPPTAASETQIPAGPAKKGFLDYATEPLITAPSRWGKQAADWKDDPRNYVNPENPTLEWLDATRRGLAGGLTEGIGNVISGLTNPADLTAMFFGGAAGAAARRGAATIAPKLLKIAKAGDIATMLHGAKETFSPDKTLAERAFGVAEMAGGGAGLGQKLPEALPRNIPPITPAGTRVEMNNLRPEEPLPDFETAIITNNQAMPDRRLRKEQIVDAVGGAEITNNAGETIDNILTGVPFGKAPSRIGVAPDLAIRPPEPPPPPDSSLNPNVFMPPENLEVPPVEAFARPEPPPLMPGDDPNAVMPEIEPSLGVASELNVDSNRRLLDILQQQANERGLGQIPFTATDPIVGGLADNAQNVTPQLPPEFSPDIRVQNEAIPETGGTSPRFDEPLTSNMRVPGSDNIAAGGADPRVLDILGTALYARDRPSTVIKELLQNSIDELKISGREENPVKVVIRRSSKSPVTGGDSPSVIVKDKGRGLTREQLYTIFTDIGKTGKGDIAEASGGFGFAKAAPLLGGDYVKVISTVEENGKIVKHTFEGTPEQLKKQNVGVPVKTEIMPEDTPTGFQVQTFFPAKQSFWQAKELLNETVTNSPNIKAVEFLEDYSYDSPTGYPDGFDPTGPDAANPTALFLNDTYTDPSNKPDYTTLTGTPLPEKTNEVAFKGSDSDIHYVLDDKERQATKVIYLNNGLFAFSDKMYHGQSPIPHVPERIVVNLKPTVEEGIDGYPFTANREGLNVKLQADIEDWIKENVIAPGRKAMSDEIQRLYDELLPAPGNKFVTFDSGQRYTPEELAAINDSPAMQSIAETMDTILTDLRGLIENPIGYTEKFGFQIGEEGAGGINIINPQSRNTGDKPHFAVLINPFSAMKIAKNPNDAAQRMVHIMLHEFTHNLAREEGGGFTWQMARVHEKFPLESQLEAKNAILNAIAEPTRATTLKQNRRYAPEIQKLLQQYTESRGRKETAPDILSRERANERISAPGQSGISASAGNNGGGTPLTPEILASAASGGAVPPNRRRIPSEHFRMPEPPGPTGIPEIDKKNWKDYIGVARAIQSAYDLSMPFRQGLGLIHTSGWWKAWPDMVKSVGSEATYKAVMESIDQRPNFQRNAGRPSFAEEAGLQLTSLGSLAKRDEEFGSKLAESIPVIGKGIRASNRAANAFMNKLRADTFDSLINDAEVAGLKPKQDLVLAKAIARYINTASGRGNFSNPKNEQALVALNQVLFSPRLMASRAQMLNPKNYLMGNNFVKKQYLKSAIALGGAWSTMAGLAQLGGADVSTDMESSDFGQIKVGNTRIDPSGGFRPYIVLARRLMNIAEKQKTSRYSGKYGARTAQQDIFDFVETKLAPPASYAWGPFGADNKFPHYVGDETVKLFTPIIVQDIIELSNEDPKMLGVAIPLAAVGFGSNTYPKGRGEEPRMTEQIMGQPLWPKKYDLRFPRR